MHLHSRFSFDSLTSPGRLLAIAEREGLDFLLLTDHDTIEGARALRALATSRGAAIEVPIAAEYKTDHGDVIAAFIQDEIRARRLEDFVAEVREQGGLILLPHPYHGHREAERLVRYADLVEIHNARIDAALNEAAATAAAAHGKPGYHASDAHLARNVARVLVEVDNRGSLRDSIAAGQIRAARLQHVGRSDLALSQYVRAVKRRDPWLFARLTLRGPYRRMRSLARRAGR